MNIKKYDDKTVNQFLKDVEDDMSRMTEELKIESANYIAKEIGEKHHNQYEIKVQETQDGNVIYTEDKKAVELEYNSGMPAWRSIHAKYRALGAK